MSDPSEPQMLSRFLDGIRQASGSAHQLAHARRDPRWLKVRDMLEAIRNSGSQLAVRSALSETATLEALNRRSMPRA